MSSFFQFGPGFIQGSQQCLSGWVTSVPRDAVWGCTKSMTVSFLVTSFLTQGNILAAAKSATFACVASITHTAAVSLIKMIGMNTGNLNKKWVYSLHAASVLALFTSYLFGRRHGMNLGWTLPATALPYILTQSLTDARGTTPLFVTIFGVGR